MAMTTSRRWRTLRPVHEDSCHLYHVLEEQDVGDGAHWLGWKTVEVHGPFDRNSIGGFYAAKRIIEAWEDDGATEHQGDVL